MLKDLRLLSEIDLHLLALGAVWWSVHVRATAAMENSLVQTTEENGRVAIPEVGVAKVAFNNVRSILQEFGIGPGSRAKVTALPEDEDQDPAARYFDRGAKIRRLLG